MFKLFECFGFQSPSSGWTVHCSVHRNFGHILWHATKSWKPSYTSDRGRENQKTRMEYTRINRKIHFTTSTDTDILKWMNWTSYSSTILDLCTRWRWVVNFTTRRLYPRLKSPRYPLDRRLDGPQSRSGRCRAKKNLFPCRESNPGRPACSPSLCRLSYLGSPMYIRGFDKYVTVPVSIAFLQRHLELPLNSSQFTILCFPRLSTENSGLKHKDLARMRKALLACDRETLTFSQLSTSYLWLMLCSIIQVFIQVIMESRRSGKLLHFLSWLINDAVSIDNI
jgi:hypothetical protein